MCGVFSFWATTRLTCTPKKARKAKKALPLMTVVVGSALCFDPSSDRPRPSLHGFGVTLILVPYCSAITRR
jgi:hypothetical protein